MRIPLTNAFWYSSKYKYAQVQPMSLGVVILSAGSSSRLGHPKQHVQFHGKPLLLHAVDLAVSFHARHRSRLRPLVVSGAFHLDDAQVLNMRRVDNVYNASWTSGMSSSIACALQARTDVSMLLFMLVDQYRVTANDLDQLYEKSLAYPDHPVATAYGSMQEHEAVGPPIIWPAKYFAALGTIKGSGKRLLQSLDYQRVALSNAWFDLDTDEDLKQLRQYETHQ